MDEKHSTMPHKNISRVHLSSIQQPTPRVFFIFSLPLLSFTMFHAGSSHRTCVDDFWANFMFLELRKRLLEKQSMLTLLLLRTYKNVHVIFCSISKEFFNQLKMINFFVSVALKVNSYCRNIKLCLIICWLFLRKISFLFKIFFECVVRSFEFILVMKNKFNKKF